MGMIRPGGAITAPGGWCAPANVPLYELGHLRRAGTVGGRDVPYDWQIDDDDLTDLEDDE
jgi:hypothetical protein